MLSRKIDLTENNDFNSNNLNLNESLVSIDIPTALSIADASNVSLDNYNKLIKRISVFGKHWHCSEADNIFDKSCKLETNMKDICQRCGRRILSWNSYYGLCKNCDDVVSYNKIPWQNKYFSITRTDDRDILRMK